MKNTLKKLALLFIGLIGESVSVVLWLFVKYRIHGLPFSSLDLTNAGNLLIIIIASISIVMLLTTLFFISRIKLKNLQVYLSLLFTMILILLVQAIFLTKDINLIEVIDNSGYEFRKVFSSIIWGIFLFIRLFIINYLFFNLIRANHLVFIKSLILIFIYVGILILYSFVFIFIFSRTSENYLYKSDAVFDTGVVLGAAVWSKDEPSPVFRARLDKAYELYKKGNLRTILVTGAKAPGELTEAQVGNAHLLSLGVASERILIEEKSTSTIEQIHFVNNQLAKKNKSLCIISDAFHLPRVHEISNFIGMKIKLIRSNYRLELFTNIWYRTRESVLLLIFWLFGV